MADEVDLYKDVDKIPKYEAFEKMNHFEQITSSIVSIYVGNLTWWTSDFDLEMAIRRLGVYDILDVFIHESNANGQSKGFARVDVKTEASAKQVMEKLPRGELNGVRPVVTPANKGTLKEFNDAFNDKLADRNQEKSKENGKPNGIVPPPIPFPMANGKSKCRKKLLSSFSPIYLLCSYATDASARNAANDASRNAAWFNSRHATTWFSLAVSTRNASTWLSSSRRPSSRNATVTDFQHYSHFWHYSTSYQ